MKTFKSRMRLFMTVQALFVITVIITACCGCGESDMKYRIYQNEVYYYTKDYVTRDGCVAFLPKNNPDSVIICGNYMIEKNPSYDPKKDKDLNSKSHYRH